MVSRPVRTQVSNKPPGDPVCCAMSEATMKMPDPIIEPSNKPMARTKPGSDFALVSARGCVVSAIRRIASAGSRVVSGSQQIDVLLGAHPRLGCAEDIADDRHGISS